MFERLVTSLVFAFLPQGFIHFGSPTLASKEEADHIQEEVESPAQQSFHVWAGKIEVKDRMEGAGQSS